jgi:hypothetical protein
MGAVISSVARPVQGGSTDFGGGLFGGLLGKVFQQAMDQQPTQPTGITSIPVTNQNPTVNMTGGRFNQVRDPRLNRIASRPMFRTSRYDSQISNLLGKLLPDSAPSTPQMRPTTDPMGRSYSDPRYYKMGGRVNYQNGGPTKTPPKYIPLNMESVAKEIFGTTNLDNLTYNEKQTIYDYIEANRNKKAYGGRIGYADGVGPIPLGLVDYRGTPWENSFKAVTQPFERKMGLATYPDGSYPDGNMTNAVQAIPRPGQYSTQVQLPSQQESIREAIMSLPQTRSNPQMNAMRRYSQVRDPRIARLLQQRQPRAMGGIMNLKMGGMPVEMDLRAKGGFVPIGKKERADDVPARLSKNEFVFTANAVRNAGNGDIRKGAKRMYNLMHQLEAKR